MRYSDFCELKEHLHSVFEFQSNTLFHYLISSFLPHTLTYLTFCKDFSDLILRYTKIYFHSVLVKGDNSEGIVFSQDLDSSKNLYEKNDVYNRIIQLHSRTCPCTPSSFYSHFDLDFTFPAKVALPVLVHIHYCDRYFSLEIKF